MRGIELLHTAVQAKARELQAICDARGLKLLITETWRTTAEQNALYAQGRTTPGRIVTNARGDSFQSPHQWGVAFDFCKNVRGQEFSDTAFFNNVGAIAKSIGLFWGGDFRSFIDRPHLEHPEYLPSNSTATLRARWGTPERFRATWSAQDTNPSSGSTGGTPVLPVRASDHPTLRQGATGEHVRYLQTRLNTLQKAGLVADGIFGPKTDAAVRAFQRARGLVIDGIVGPKTWGALG